MALYGFNKKNAGRVARSVRYTESGRRGFEPGRRRRGPFGGGGSASAALTGALAVIKGTVPKSSALDVSGDLIDCGTGEVLEGKGFIPGMLPADPPPFSCEFNAQCIKTFNEGALLMNPDGKPIVLEMVCTEGGGGGIGGGGGSSTTYYVLDIVDVLNPSTDADYIGQGDGEIVAGHLLEMDLEVEGQDPIHIRAFIPPTRDLRTWDGYESGKAAMVYREADDAVEKILAKFSKAKQQSIGHNIDASPEWQDDGECD